uniref:tRNA pseudouridine synthase n=1 Tax=Sinocyclocheilus anshuiensis TaxID=1608454 RepID=A0A671N8L0_9TELE
MNTFPCRSCVPSSTTSINQICFVCHSVLFPRIGRAYRVHSDFHARTYVYRFALGLRHHTEMPVTERDLCWALLRDTRLSIDAMLLGTHDFSTFRALSSETPFKSPVKTQLEPAVSFSQRRFHRDIQLTFKSRYFLYRLVQRMTGALVVVGQGRLSVSQIQELLEARDSLYRDTGKTCSEYRSTH